MTPQDGAAATILVVDDSAVCREAIADMLRLRGYPVICAESGAQALAVLASCPVALVLLDMLMPVMDGLSVLRTLRRNPRHRQLPVVLLTDVAQPDTVRKVAALGVQGYLLKSQFSVNDLLGRVKQYLPEPASVSDVRSPADLATPRKSALPKADAPAENRSSRAARGPRRRAEVLDAVLSHIELNPVPPVLHQVLSQTQSSSSSIHDVVESIRRDQALAVRVMKVAKSSFYATGKPPRNVTDAASRLGMSGIRSAIVPAVAIDHFSAAADTGLVPQRFWEHSLATATVAQCIAESLHSDNAEELFLAGLLHDLGRLLLSTSFPDDYAELIATATSKNLNLAALEREAFEIDVTEVTREALTRLGLSGPIANAASFHQRPAAQLTRAGQDGSNGLIVALADRLARAYALGHSGDDVLLPMGEYVDAVGLGPDELRRIGRQVADALADAELLYACYGNEQFLQPLSRELAQAIRPPCRVAVAGDNVAINPVSLFFEQLGWIEQDAPEIIVFSQDMSGRPPDLAAAWSAFADRFGSELPCLIVATDASTLPPLDNLREKRRCETIDLASRYLVLINACARLRHEPVRAQV